MLKRLRLLGMAALISEFVSAQDPANIHGYVTDRASGEAIAGANIFIQGSYTGTSSNKYGFYSIAAPSDTFLLEVHVVGYQHAIILINPSVNRSFDIELTSRSYELQEVTITGESAEDELSGTESIALDIEQIRQFPRLLGEADPLKFIQILPGIKQGREGSASIYVRGGTPDQNLILLDGVPLYNVYHLFGYLSVFNVDAVKSINIYKSGIPSRYEGRLSSVIDITTKEGNLKEKKKSFSLSPVAGSLMIETPLKENKSSITFTGRTTWLDKVFQVITMDQDNSRGFNFYDLNAKYQNRISEKNTIYASIYSSRDKFYDRYRDRGSDGAKYGFKWGNYTGLFRWNSQLSDRLFLTTSTYYSHYLFNQVDEFVSVTTRQTRKVNSNIQEWNSGFAFNYFPSPYHGLHFGTQLGMRTFKPEVTQLINDDNSFGLTNMHAETVGIGNIFVEDNIRVFRNLRLNLGLRNSLYLQNEQPFFCLQPRAAVDYDFTGTLGIRASYDRVVQTIHLLTNTTLGQPTDLWVPATGKVPAGQSDQFSVGIIKKLPFNSLEIGVDAYYKTMANVIEYKEGANYIFGIDEGWEEKVSIGDGTSKGMEFQLKRNGRKLNGILSYTLSKTSRKFDEINNGRAFPFKYDRRHDASFLVNYNFSPTKKLTGHFTYYTGNAITLPTAKVRGILPPGWQHKESEEVRNQMQYQNYTGARNNVRMPAYHRLDINYSTSKEIKNDRTRTWIFSVYNAYNRLNPYFIYESRGKLKQYAFFPIVPSVSYQLEF